MKKKKLYSLECAHCGSEAITKEVNEFSDGEGERCESCGMKGHVDCDSESEPRWVSSVERGDYCNDALCEDCNFWRATRQ